MKNKKDLEIMVLERGKFYWCSYKANNRWNKKRQVRFSGMVMFLGEQSFVFVEDVTTICIYDLANVRFFECDYSLLGTGKEFTEVNPLVIFETKKS